MEFNPIYAVLQGHRCFVSKLDPFHPESNHTKIQLNQLEITKLATEHRELSFTSSADGYQVKLYYTSDNLVYLEWSVVGPTLLSTPML